jgi:hypothetical protein
MLQVHLDPLVVANLKLMIMVTAIVSSKTEHAPSAGNSSSAGHYYTMAKMYWSASTKSVGRVGGNRRHCRHCRFRRVDVINYLSRVTDIFTLACILGPISTLKCRIPHGRMTQHVLYNPATFSWCLKRLQPTVVIVTVLISSTSTSCCSSLLLALAVTVVLTLVWDHWGPACRAPLGPLQPAFQAAKVNYMATLHALWNQPFRLVFNYHHVLTAYNTYIIPHQVALNRITN